MPEKTHLCRVDDIPRSNPLLLSLLRVLLPRDISNAIQDLKDDHDSGARQLALKALRVLHLVATTVPSEKSSWPELVNYAWYIIQARPSMKAAIETTILRTLHDLQREYPSSRTCEIIEQHIADESAALEKLSTNFTDYILSLSLSKIRILTLSFSSTILAALLKLFKASPAEIVLTILESRPLLEGVSLAKALVPHKPQNCTIEVSTDASAAYFSKRADIVLLGADKVNAISGDVSNKVGSLTAATFCEGKVLCLTSTDKIVEVDKGVDEVDEENAAEEVTKIWNTNAVEGDGVGVRNLYFEWIPGNEIDAYVTETGSLNKGDLKEVLQQRKGWEGIWKVLDTA